MGGAVVGAVVGAAVGVVVGAAVGTAVGTAVGAAVGAAVVGGADVVVVVGGAAVVGCKTVPQSPDTSSETPPLEANCRQPPSACVGWVKVQVHFWAS